mmetsp:Transcript_34454/g.102342  ORF Transcript_34454/g.102342 Transcript_34454/m.102342 type:complete len:86 (-) Transcript_34454:761-1018(-)
MLPQPPAKLHIAEQIINWFAGELCNTSWPPASIVPLVRVVLSMQLAACSFGRFAFAHLEKVVQLFCVWMWNRRARNLACPRRSKL